MHMPRCRLISHCPATVAKQNCRSPGHRLHAASRLCPLSLSEECNITLGPESSTRRAMLCGWVKPERMRSPLISTGLLQ